MELLMISETKLKITLSDEDMISYSLSSEAIDYEDAATRSALRRILLFAKNKIGFDSDKKRIFIQLYPSKNGGCELYVTKLMQENSADNSDFVNNTSKSEKLPKLPVISRMYSSNKEYNIIFSFSSIENLISCCNEIRNMNYIVTSQAYCLKYGNAYFLKLNFDFCFYGFKIVNILSEFGCESNKSKMLLESNEYTTVLCNDNAVETLGML